MRVTGPATPQEVAARLRAQLTAARFSPGERLAGRISDSGLRVWRKTPLAGHSDVVQFEGEIQPAGTGTVISGTARYKLATRIQLLGFFGIGVLLAAVSVLRADGDLLAFGLFLAALSAAWIVACHGMRNRQIEYIEARLAAITAA